MSSRVGQYVVMEAGRLADFLEASTSGDLAEVRMRPDGVQGLMKFLPGEVPGGLPAGAVVRSWSEIRAVLAAPPWVGPPSPWEP